MHGSSPARQSNQRHEGPGIGRLADKGEERLRRHCREKRDREPTQEEVEWTRDFPRRIVENREGDPRPPTVTEMKEHFGWGMAEETKRRLGFHGVNYR